ncbi:MAG TPA: RES family NAD+ phosphorylase [Sphingomicrobium sp.]|nr:RES family NAD+ phosphorylase [Sphingomicrobium sp.]
MRLWRVSKYLELNGGGGLTYEGRWNTSGRRIVYSAETSALAMLEMLVRVSRTRRPPPFQLLEIDAPDGLALTEFGATPPESIDESRTWGDRWLAKASTSLARVPSVIAPKCFNYLINPAHSDAPKVSVIAQSRYPWDERLFR